MVSVNMSWSVLGFGIHIIQDSDQYSLAVLLWEIYSEKVPWAEKRPTEVFKAVVVNTETLNTTILSCSNY